MPSSRSLLLFPREQALSDLPHRRARQPEQQVDSDLQK
jgi:hypothetical protein